MRKNPFQESMTDLALRRKVLWEALWRTQAFKSFLREGCLQSEEDTAAFIKIRDGEPGTVDKPEDWQPVSWQEIAVGAFLQTPEGEAAAERLGLLNVRAGAVAYSFRPESSSLRLVIDLTQPKEKIEREFKRLLDEFHPKVERPPIPTRGDKKRDLDEIYQMLGDKRQLFFPSNDNYFSRFFVGRIAPHGYS